MRVSFQDLLVRSGPRAALLVQHDAELDWTGFANAELRDDELDFFGIAGLAVKATWRTNNPDAVAKAVLEAGLRSLHLFAIGQEGSFVLFEEDPGRGMLRFDRFEGEPVDPGIECPLGHPMARNSCGPWEDYLSVHRSEHWDEAMAEFHATLERWFGEPVATRQQLIDQAKGRWPEISDAEVALKRLTMPSETALLRCGSGCGFIRLNLFARWFATEEAGAAYRALTSEI